MPLLDLTIYGYSTFHQEHFRPYDQKRLLPGRVSAEFQGIFHVITPRGEYLSRPSGLLRRSHQDSNALPVIGDFVALEENSQNPDELTIVATLPRRTVLSRRSPGGDFNQQAIAANIDLILILTSLADEYNPRRLERFMVPAVESGAKIILISSKHDLPPKSSAASREMALIANKIPVIHTSSMSLAGVSEVKSLFSPGLTGVLLGSSGTGKSTLANLLAEENLQRTGENRSDGKGRHTTTNKQLLLLPEGGLLIDTPGLREMQMWASQWAIDKVFSEIHSAAQNCRFSNCTHRHEPGCHVRELQTNGQLSEERIESYLRLSEEVRALDALGSRPRTREERAKAKHLHRIFNPRGKSERKK